MAALDVIWDCARACLVLGDRRGHEDVFLWEHSARVARSAMLIAGLPEVAPRRVDSTALWAAALFHEAGWVTQWREKLVERCDVLARPTSDLQRELAASLLEDRLSHVLRGQTLETAILAVRQSNMKDTSLAEAQILAEADSLDEVGTLSFWLTVRRHSHEGKGIQAAIDFWERQKEYKYWEARIADAFRLDAVRELARQRLKVLGAFMEELARQHQGEDLALLAGVDPALADPRLPRPVG